MSDPLTTSNKHWEPTVDDTTPCPRCGSHGLYTVRQARQRLNLSRDDLHVRAATGDMGARTTLRDRFREQAPDFDHPLLTDAGMLKTQPADVWCPACGEFIDAAELTDDGVE